MSFNCKGEGKETVCLQKQGTFEITFKFIIEPTKDICSCYETKNVFKYVLQRVKEVKNARIGDIVPLKSRLAKQAIASLKKSLSKTFCNKCTPKFN